MDDPKTKPRWGTWTILTVLLGFLGLAIVFLYVGWGRGEDDLGSDISGSGYVAMALGIVATMALGIGLMTLVFVGNRRRRD